MTPIEAKAAFKARYGVESDIWKPALASILRKHKDYETILIEMLDRSPLAEAELKGTYRRGT